MPLSAPFSFTRILRRAYLEKFTVNGEVYTLEEILEFISNNLSEDAVILPEYNSAADATANGIVSGQRWKYAAGNHDGMPPGVVVEQL